MVVVIGLVREVFHLMETMVLLSEESEWAVVEVVKWLVRSLVTHSFTQ